MVKRQGGGQQQNTVRACRGGGVEPQATAAAGAPSQAVPALQTDAWPPACARARCSSAPAGLGWNPHPPTEVSVVAAAGSAAAAFPERGSVVGAIQEGDGQAGHSGHPRAAQVLDVALAGCGRQRAGTGKAGPAQPQQHVPSAAGAAAHAAAALRPQATCKRLAHPPAGKLFVLQGRTSSRLTAERLQRLLAAVAPAANEVRRQRRLLLPSDVGQQLPAVVPLVRPWNMRVCGICKRGRGGMRGGQRVRKRVQAA